MSCFCGYLQEDVRFALAEHLQVRIRADLGHGTDAPAVLSCEAVLVRLQEAGDSGRKTKEQILAGLFDDLHLVVVADFKK